MIHFTDKDGFGGYEHYKCIDVFKEGLVWATDKGPRITRITIQLYPLKNKKYKILYTLLYIYYVANTVESAKMCLCLVLLNPLTHKRQKTGIIIIIKPKHRKRKHQKTGFQMHASNKLP